MILGALFGSRPFRRVADAVHKSLIWNYVPTFKLSFESYPTTERGDSEGDVTTPTPSTRPGRRPGYHGYHDPRCLSFTDVQYGRVQTKRYIDL